ALAVVAERTPPGGGSIMSSHSCHRIMGRHPPRPALSKSAVSSVGRAQPTRRRYPPSCPRLYREAHFGTQARGSRLCPAAHFARTGRVLYGKSGSIVGSESADCQPT